MNRQDLMNYKNDLQYLNTKREDLIKRREALYKTTTNYGDTFGGKKEIQDKIAEKLAIIIDEEAKLVEETIVKLDKLKSVNKILDEMENKEYRNILYFMYISEEAKNLTEVANKIGKEYKYTCRLHGKALNEFDKICKKHDKSS